MDISVVLSTYNRCDILPRALEHLARQQTRGLEVEIIVVDNNSTDETKAVIESFAARDKRIRYLFEPRQGVSYGRNAGIAAARADAIVFTDDDVEVASDWIYRIHQALLHYPDADFIGGRVLPVLKGLLPVWAHAKMAPFALQDYGDDPVVVSAAHQRCLIGACLVARRRAILRAGLFSTETQKVKGELGDTEDADWEIQVWNCGGHGVYVPQIIVYSPVASERLAKSYHRRWHLGHGKFHAKARRPEFETARRLLDVPAFVYRQVLQNCFEFALLSLQFNKIEAFERENRFLFSLGFIAERWKTLLSHPQIGRRAAAVDSLAG
jgi:glycosyltransferase involved in cell wall biosynthesis